MNSGNLFSKNSRPLEFIFEEKDFFEYNPFEINPLYGISQEIPLKDNFSRMEMHTYNMYVCICTFVVICIYVPTIYSLYTYVCMCRKMIVTLQCNKDMTSPVFTALGEPEKSKEYVRHIVIEITTMYYIVWHC